MPNAAVSWPSNAAPSRGVAMLSSAPPRGAVAFHCGTQPCHRLAGPCRCSTIHCRGGAVSSEANAVHFPRDAEHFHRHAEHLHCRAMWSSALPMRCIALPTHSDASPRHPFAMLCLSMPTLRLAYASPCLAGAIIATQPIAHASQLRANASRRCASQLPACARRCCASATPCLTMLGRCGAAFCAALALRSVLCFANASLSTAHA